MPWTINLRFRQLPPPRPTERLFRLRVANRCRQRLVRRVGWVGGGGVSTQHPITSLEELVARLRNSSPHHLQSARETWIITHAYAAGADMELDACCTVIDEVPMGTGWWADSRHLRHVRRPKPPIQKGKALAVLDDCSKHLDAAHENVLRRALEALSDEN